MNINHSASELKWTKPAQTADGVVATTPLTSDLNISMQCVCVCVCVCSLEHSNNPRREGKKDQNKTNGPVWEA